MRIVACDYLYSKGGGGGGGGGVGICVPARVSLMDVKKSPWST